MNVVQKLIETLDEQSVRTAFLNAHCQSVVARNLNIRQNATNSRLIIQGLISRFNIDISHFDRGKKQRRYINTKKFCPVCNELFETIVGHRNEKTTCSRKCSNTYFRSGQNNGSHQKKLKRIDSGEREFSYQEICWTFHKKSCVVCGEDLIVEAHHYNGVHTDNRPQNFVPLCPTHHQYWHSKHRHLIQAQVDDYVNVWKFWAHAVKQGTLPLEALRNVGIST